MSQPAARAPRPTRLASATLTAAAVLVAPFAAPAPASAQSRPAPPHTAHRAPVVAYTDSLTLPRGMAPFGVPFGGISGLDHVPGTHRYLALSDDRAQNGPARFYTISIDAGTRGFGRRGVKVEKMTRLTDTAGRPYAAKSVDPESIRLVPGGRLIVWSDEGGVNGGIAPKLHVSTIAGREVRQLPVPKQFLPATSGGRQVAGIRDNQGFEGLTLSPDHRRLTVIAENGLVQDSADGATTRMAVIDRWTGANPAQYVYRTADPAFGVSELLQTGRHDYLSVERRFVDGTTTIRVYAVSTAKASNVASRAKLTGSERAVRKTLVADLSDSGADPDNVETLTFGPRGRDGRRTLILNSDDNFSDQQRTVFHLLTMRARRA